MRFPLEPNSTFEKSLAMSAVMPSSFWVTVFQICAALVVLKADPESVAGAVGSVAGASVTDAGLATGAGIEAATPTGRVGFSTTGSGAAGAVTTGSGVVVVGADAAADG